MSQQFGKILQFARNVPTYQPSKTVKLSNLVTTYQEMFIKSSDYIEKKQEMTAHFTTRQHRKTAILRHHYWD